MTGNHKADSFLENNNVEKSPLALSDDTSTKPKTFFGRRKRKRDDVAVDTKETVAKVSFLKMFKYAMWWEKLINVAGLVCAAGSGVSVIYFVCLAADKSYQAIQPCLALLFGRLITVMNTFFQVATVYKQNRDNPEVIERFNIARDDFRDGVNTVCIDMLVIGIAMFVGVYIFQHAWVFTSERISSRIRSMYLRSILRQDIAFFDNIGAGEVATRIETDTHLVQSGISEKVANAAMFIGTFIAGFIIAFAQQAKIAGVLFVIVPMIAIAGAGMNVFTSKYSQNALTCIAESGSLVEEVISTIRTAKAFGSQVTLLKLYDTYLSKARSQGFKTAISSAVGLCIFFFVIYASYALAFVWGVTLLLRNETEVGEIVGVLISTMIGSFSLAIAAPELQAIAKGQAAAAKIFDTIERIPPIDSASEEGLKPPSVAGNITFEDIDFSYPARLSVQVMKNFTTTFHKGHLTALVGASGSGKSTAIGLIERFYDPLSGVVKLDGNDLRDLNVKWLRSKIGMVGQEPVLFNETLRANVEHGLIGTEMEHWPDEQRLELVINACKVANADGFINTLPEKYDNSVGERGMLLSGGQKQRVAIARAIVSDPPILLLDEATAALDSTSESIVQKALDKAAKNRTTIAIAHRLSTIKNANQIIVMGGGEILEVGDHNSLTANPDGAYSTFVAAQSLAQAKDEEAAQVKSDVVEKDSDLQEDIIPLNRAKSGRSVTSQILEKRNEEKDEKEHHYSMFEVIRRLVKMNRPGWSAYTSGSIAAFVTGSAYPIMGILLGRILQHIAAKSPADPDYHSYIRHQIDRDSLWFFIMAIGAALGILIQSWAMHYAGELLTYALRHESFKKLLRSDVEYFDKKENSTGVLTSNLADNAQKVQGLAGISASTIIQSCSTLIVGVAIGIGYNWKLGLVGTACIPLTLSAGITRLKIVVTKDQQNKKSYEDSAQMACEAAGAIRTVASLTREDQALEEYQTLLRTPLRNSIRTSVWSSAIYGISQGMAFLVIALIFWYGSQLIMNLEIELEDFYVCLMAVVFSSIQAGNVFTFVPDVSNARGGAARILKLLDTKTEIEIETTSQEGKHLDTVEGHITFEDVHFRYPTRSDVPVLRSLNLEIKPGSYVALVGPSGCGKSTTIQLMERFYDPAYGSVKLDSHEVRDLNLNNLRSHMALVSQEPTLYAGTVKYNILMGAVKPHEEVSQQELEDACADANILDFIRDLPDGFETQVGGKGTQLSGGQKQRIAIARALIRKPKILLLDEATSALDQTSEAVVQAALDKVASGRTTIAIAHRLSTIQKADRIYVIKDGTVSQAGTHKELIEQKNGLYAELVALQTLSTRDA